MMGLSINQSSISHKQIIKFIVIKTIRFMFALVKSDVIDIEYLIMNDINKLIN